MNPSLLSAIARLVNCLQKRFLTRFSFAVQEIDVGETNCEAYTVPPSLSRAAIRQSDRRRVTYRAHRIGLSASHLPVLRFASSKFLEYSKFLKKRGLPSMVLASKIH